MLNLAPESFLHCWELLESMELMRRSKWVMQSSVLEKCEALNELPSLSTPRWVSGFSGSGLYWSTERLLQKPCGSLTVLWLQRKSKYLLAQRGSSCQTRSGSEAVKRGLLRRAHTVRSSRLLPSRITVPVADRLGHTQTRRLVLEQRGKAFFFFPIDGRRRW